MPILCGGHADTARQFSNQVKDMALFISSSDIIQKMFNDWLVDTGRALPEHIDQDLPMKEFLSEIGNSDCVYVIHHIKA